MMPMGAADGRDRASVTRRVEPVVNRRPDLAALDGRLARPMMAGDQQDDALAPRDRLVEPAVDRLPSRVEGQPVKVEHSVRLDRAGAKATVPACIECLADPPGRPDWRLFGTPDTCDWR